MTKFKIGDRVRYVAINCYAAQSDGAVGTVISGGDVAIVRWDCDGSSSRNSDQYLSLIANPNELATLRAFQQRALARYPDLADPESDEDAAKRIAVDFEYAETADCVAAGVAWARANPR